MGNKNSTKTRKYLVIIIFSFSVFYISLVYADVINTIRITAVVPYRVYNSLTPSNGGVNGFLGPISLTRESIIFKGIAYPKSTIKLTKDGVLVSTIKTIDSSFEIVLKDISPGVHNFGIQAIDTNGEKSLLLTYSIHISSNFTTTVNGLLLPPTISIDKIEVKKDDTLTVAGQTIPKAKVKLVFNSATKLIKNTFSDEEGFFIYNLNTQELEYGEHEVKIQALTDTESTPFSRSLEFKIGNKNILRIKNKNSCIISDINCDGKVNLVDFSITAYWYRRSNPPKNVDLNGDNKVDLSDFSIIAYHWTG